MPRKSNTRSAQGSGSIRQRSDGTWEARYSLGNDPGTGKPIRKSVYGKTQKEVRQRLTEALANIDAGVYLEPARMTLAQWLDVWLAEYMGDKKYSTAKHYKAVVNTHIKPALGAVKLSRLTPHQIQSFYNQLQKNGRTTPKKDEAGHIQKDKSGKTITETVPLSAKTVRNIHCVLTKSLSVAVSIGYIRDNPAQRVTLPRTTKKEICPLTDDQIKQFLQITETDRHGTLLTIILFTGLREAEAIGLTWDCIDWKAGTIRVYRQLQKRPQEDGGYTFTTLKNDKSRVIKPASYVMDLLAQRQREQIEESFKAGRAWEAWKNLEEHKTALIFTTEIGSPINPKQLYLHYKKLAAQIGAPNSRVHDLRHTFAVLSLQNGDAVKTVQENLGHATAAFTLDVYGHVSERMRDESSQRMQTYISGISNL